MTQIRAPFGAPQAPPGPLAGLLGNAAIVAAWLWLYGSILSWLAVVPFVHQRYRLNLGLLLLCAALICGRSLLARRALPARPAAPRLWSFLATPPRLRPRPLFLCLLPAAFFVAAERWIGIHSLSALFFGLSTYGLCGLYLSPERFRRGLPAALLLVAVLPFGAYANTYIGLFLRLLTAEAVQAMLRAQHVASISAQTILVLENGVAHIDIPCSGLRSLWAGGLFFLGATWIDRRPVGGPWLLCGGLLFLLLCMANAARVYLLVLVGLVANQPQLASIIHEPLGVIGFVLSCGAAYLLLRRVGHAPPVAAGSAVLWPARRADLAVVLSLLALGGLHATRPPGDDDGVAPRITLPSSVQPRPAPLTTGERLLFSRFGARADKWYLAPSGAPTGSLITVSTTAWRAQHPPELCLSSAGLRILSMHNGGRDFPLRVLQLRDGDRPRTAVYWFQSRTRTTPDFVTRALSALRRSDRRWVMASLLFDGPADPEDPAVRRLLTDVHQAIQRGLQGVSP